MPFLSSRATLSPDLPALIWDGGRSVLTYAELADRVDQAAATLHRHGLQAGERVAVWLDNSVEYVILIHAALRLGLALLPLNRRLSEAERAWQVEQVGCRAVITPENLKSFLGDGVGATSLHKKLSGQIGYAKSVPLPATEPADFVALLMFTSGTTGRPKAAQLTLSNLLAAAQASSQRLQTQQGERWLLCLPLYHIGGMSILFRACLDGLTVVLQERFEADETFRLLHKKNVNLISLVPTMLYRLMPHFESGASLPDLRLILLGGAAPPPNLLRRALDCNLPIALTYGLTEACAQVATALPEEVRQKPGTVGKPLTGIRVEITNDAGQSCSAGQVGEIVVQGPGVMPGYLGQPPLVEGRLRTGDLGYRDEDGDLWIVSRRSDLILSGGENVYPEEVEQALLQHPAVEAACVVGLPDAEWGQQVTAAVVRRSSCEAAELLHFLRGRLAGYKIPRRLVFLETLPYTASGKLKRMEVAEMLKRQFHLESVDEL
ncbi:MAG: o-succinylbenzoate--CoA ligase [Anaerolineae bacterium]